MTPVVPMQIAAGPLPFTPKVEPSAFLDSGAANDA